MDRGRCRQTAARTAAVSRTRSNGIRGSTSLQPRNTGVPSSEPASSRVVPGGPMSPPEARRRSRIAERRAPRTRSTGRPPGRSRAGLTAPARSRLAPAAPQVPRAPTARRKAPARSPRSATATNTDTRYSPSPAGRGRRCRRGRRRPPAASCLSPRPAAVDEDHRRLRPLQRRAASDDGLPRMRPSRGHRPYDR